MPRTSAEVTREDIAALEKKLSSKGINLTCPICRAQSWEAFGHIVAPLTYSPGAFSLGGTTYPTLNLVCTNCGAVQAFSAVLLGLE